MTSPAPPPSPSQRVSAVPAAFCGRPCLYLAGWVALVNLAMLAAWAIWQPGPPVSAEGFLALHALIELCAIVVFLLVVVVSRSGGHSRANRNMALLGAAYLAAALLTLFHLINYPGMPGLLPPASADKAQALGLAARLIAAFAMLAVSRLGWEVTIDRRSSGLLIVMSLGMVAVLTEIAMLRPDWLPRLVEDDHTSTPLKLGLQIVLVTVLLLAALGFYRLAERHEPQIAPGVRFDPFALLGAVIILALGETLLMAQGRLDGIPDLVGHIDKLAAALLVYRGIVAVQLFQGETLSRLALDAAAVGSWSWDIERGLVESDDATAAIWGIAHARRLASEAFEERIHPDDRAMRRAALRDAMDAGGDGRYRCEFRIQGADGGSGTGIRHVLDIGRLEREDGRAVRLLGISRDVTEDKQKEAVARSLEARLSQVLAIAADAIISVDDRQRIFQFNTGAEAIFGYRADEVIGRPIEMLLPERFRSAHHGHVAGFAAGSIGSRRMAERSEIFGVDKWGREFPAEASISKLVLDGQMTYTVVLRDVTARKRAERALAEANSDLERQVAERTMELHVEMERREQAQSALAKAQRMEAFGQLAGGIAHDFNNLLTVISGNQELLEMRLQDPKDLALLKRANEAAEMGARLTARLLLFSRRRKLEPVVLDLNEQIIGMVELLRRSIGEQVTLTTNLAPRLGALRADPSEIENAILNLAINARDAMPSGGVLVIETRDLTIDPDEAVALKIPPGAYVRLSVSDTGCGMSQEVLQHAFEPFFTTKQPGKGTGLGLSTIYGFAQQSGGTVTAYSEIGRGTSINLYLPRVEDDADAPGRRMVSEEVPLGHGETILVVEDNADVRAVAVERLMALGYTVLQAANGPAALATLQDARAGEITLVLSDVVMPGGMSGFDLVRWIATNRPTIRALLSSGYPDEIALANEGRLPAIRLLRKPYSRGELARAVREALGD